MGFVCLQFLRWHQIEWHNNLRALCNVIHSNQPLFNCFSSNRTSVMHSLSHLRHFSAARVLFPYVNTTKRHSIKRFLLVRVFFPFVWSTRNFLQELKRAFRTQNSTRRRNHKMLAWLFSAFDRINYITRHTFWAETATFLNANALKRLSRRANKRTKNAFL